MPVCIRAATQPGEGGGVGGWGGVGDMPHSCAFCNAIKVLSG